MRTTKSVFRRSVLFLSLLGSSVLLSGCESTKRMTTSKLQTPAVQVSRQSPAEQGGPCGTDCSYSTNVKDGVHFEMSREYYA